MPIMVVAMQSALRIASSVASAAASNNGVMASGCRLRTGNGVAIVARDHASLPVSKARKRSPLPLFPYPPTLARPIVARRAIRLH